MECSKDQRKGIEPEATYIDDHDEEISPLNKNLDWETQIELLNLQHQQITVVKNLELFINVRKLNLMDNNIGKI